jgi:hypothetical protein
MPQISLRKRYLDRTKEPEIPCLRRSRGHKDIMARSLPDCQLEFYSRVLAKVAFAETRYFLLYLAQSHMGPTIITIYDFIL